MALFLALIMCLDVSITANAAVLNKPTEHIANVVYFVDFKDSNSNFMDGKVDKVKDMFDGNKDTYYMTPASNTMQDHYRNIDLNLDGIYELSKIVIYNNEGSYNHYQIYTSSDGVNYDKVAYKSDDKMASDTGDEYTLDVNASHVRINLSYNSKQMEGNLAEVELYGSKVGELNDKIEKIEVADFEDTKWAKEYEKFSTDENYANGTMSRKSAS